MATMTSNLYPPLVDDTMPSIKKEQGQYKIYFSFPLATSPKDINFIQLSLINQRTNISALKSNSEDKDHYYPVGIKNITYWTLDESTNSNFKYYIILNELDLVNNKLELNNYYKVQLRFGNSPNLTTINSSYKWIDQNKIYCSEWSKVCLIKGIGNISVQLNEFPSSEQIGQQKITFTNTLSQISGTISFENGEKEYLKSYNVKILKEDSNKVILASDEIYTNKYNPNEIYYEVSANLDNAENYILLFTYTTSNGYTESIEYTFDIVENSSSDLPIKEVVAQPDEENGRIKISTIPKTGQTFVGNITFRRTSSETNFSIWEDIYTTSYTSNTPLACIWYDNTIESGVFYQYAVQKRNSLGHRGNIYTTSRVICVFDDIILTKKDAQLKIKFNPSLSEFKYNVTESQAVTIGSKYPYIRRNGANYFRSFPIGGLISSLIDMSNWYDPHFDTIYDTRKVSNEDNALLNTAKVGSAKIGLEEDTTLEIQGAHNHDDSKFHSERNELKLFTSKDKIYNKNFTYESPNNAISAYYERYNSENNINEYNDYIYERKFREQVYNFLYKNDVKLFRSTTEGNILIKLMNIDFQPIETLGRMLYSFTATAVEIDEANIKNYDKYGIQTIGDYDRYVVSYSHKTGEITQTFNTNENIINTVIQQQYNLIAPEGYITTITGMNYLKLEIDSQPYVIVDKGGQLVKAGPDDSTENAFLGYLVTINENTIIIPPMIQRRNDYPDEDTSKPDIIHLGFFELKGDNIQINNLQFSEPMTMTLSYEVDIADEEDTTKLVKSYYHYRNIGQLYQVFQPHEVPVENTNDLSISYIAKDIYSKYFFNFSDYYERLIWIDEIDIEGPTNTVVYIKAPDQKKFNRILLINGFYQFKDKEFIDKSENELTEFMDLFFYGRHFVKRTSFTPKHFTIDNGYYESISEINNPDPNKIYNIHHGEIIFDEENFNKEILYISSTDDLQYQNQDEYYNLIIPENTIYDQYVFYNENWYLVKKFSLTTGEPKNFKEYLRLDDAEYIEILEIYTSLDEIEEPILNGMYTLSDNTRHLYYDNQWYLLNEYNDIFCPVEGIINYTYQVEKGVYNK